MSASPECSISGADGQPWPSRSAWLQSFQPSSDPSLREARDTVASGPPIAEAVISPHGWLAAKRQPAHAPRSGPPIVPSESQPCVGEDGRFVVDLRERAKQRRVLPIVG